MEDPGKDGIVCVQAFAAQLFEGGDQFPPLVSQMGTGLFVGVHHFYLQVLFGGLDLAPDGFIGHFQGFGCLVDRSGPGDTFQDFHTAFAENDIIALIDNPVAGPEF